MNPERAKAIRLLALDVDGVLTDGSIIIDDMGVETKRFFVRDGQGITAWLKLGFDVAIITRRGGGGAGQALQHRARELGITRIVQGSRDKSAALDDLLRDTGLPPEHVAYIGDDWADLPAMRRVGLPIAVADAATQVCAIAAYVTIKPGGYGAVREAIELILRAKGLLDRAVEMCGVDEPRK